MIRRGLAHALRPLAPVPLLFVAVAALGLEFASRAGLLGIPLLAILLSWVAKYAFILLETEAHGRPPPVLSIEAVNPVGEWRPLAALLIVATAVGIVRLLRTAAGEGAALAATASFALATPAALAVLAIEGQWLRALWPPAWLAVARGLGAAYLVLCAVPVLYVLALAALAEPPPVLGTALLIALVLSYATLLGGAIHERRDALGFEPIESPERAAAALAAANDRASRRGIDEIYGLVRARRVEDAWAEAQRWLAERGRSPEAYAELREHAAQWDDRQVADALTRDLVARLLALGRGGDALLAVEAWWRRGGAFRPRDARNLAQLATLAASLGHAATADRLLVECGPAFATDPEVAALLARRGLTERARGVREPTGG